jgi:hypothetical protein
MRFGAWNVRNLYGTGSLAATARELARHKLILVSVQEFMWGKGGAVRAGNFSFFYVTIHEKHQLGTGFVVHHRI